MSAVVAAGYVAVGAHWVRADQIAVVSDHEVLLVGHPRDVTIRLGDDETAEDVLQRMATVAGSVDVAGWRDDGAPVDDGPPL